MSRSGSEKHLLLMLCSFALLVRLVYGFAILDLRSEKYWEYGEIAKNLHFGHGYSLFSHNGAEVTHIASPSAMPYPSAHMPPAYVAFLFPFFFVEETLLRNALIVIVQSLIACLVVFVMYRWARIHFSVRTALLSALITAVLPEFVYATGSVTPTILFHALFLATLPLLYVSSEHESTKSVAFAALGCAGLIYLRSEFALFCLLLVTFILFRRNFRSAALFSAVIVLSILPWLVRNAVELESFIPLTTNFGQNLYRGHNSLELGAWADEAMWREASAIKGGPQFEMELNGFYTKRALEYIMTHPVQEVENSFTKLIHLWLWNPDDVRSKSLLYRIPWILLLLFAAIGMRHVRLWTEHWPVLLFLIASTSTAVLFFVLPRYQTMMKIALVPFAVHGILMVWDRIRGNTSDATEQRANDDWNRQ